ncbi:hypothetical protein NOVA_03970 [Nocardia nova]|uniref:hypothetical protein n=1 Tax=Nocardia nova TaxID=37330 RepID=UPI001C49308F|nr:hypothetical protein [Nocardia nova]MBV7701918.1 hypothetical protein [Nocardia nova]
MAANTEAVAAAVEAYVAQLSDDEFTQMVTRTREPEAADPARTLVQGLFSRRQTNE